jgi:hypothetical protein
MMWFLRRLLALWCTLLALCMIAIGIGRIIREPDRLQEWGLDVCNGEPCVRGIALRMSWDEASPRLPQATQNGLVDLMNIPLGDQLLDIDVSAGRIERIWIRSALNHVSPYPSVADVLLKYGPPCRVYFGYGAIGFVPQSIYLSYPQLTFGVGTRQRPPPLDLTLMAPVDSITLGGDTSYLGKCSDPDGPNSSSWHGFTSADRYVNRWPGH